MNWTTLNGSKIKFNIHRYRIKWDRPAPSKGAQRVKDFLRKHCFHDVIGEEVTLPKTRYRADFVNWTKKFVLEFDGSQHATYSKHFHRGSRINFLHSIKKDVLKTQMFEKNGFKAVVVTDEDLPVLTRDWFKVQYDIDL